MKGNASSLRTHKTFVEVLYQWPRVGDRESFGKSKATVCLLKEYEQHD